MLPKSVAVLPCHLGWRTLLKCNKTNHACLPACLLRDCVRCMYILFLQFSRVVPQRKFVLQRIVSKFSYVNNANYKGTNLWGIRKTLRAFPGALYCRDPCSKEMQLALDLNQRNIGSEKACDAGNDTQRKSRSPVTGFIPIHCLQVDQVLYWRVFFSSNGAASWLNCWLVLTDQIGSVRDDQRAQGRWSNTAYPISQDLQYKIEPDLPGDIILYKHQWYVTRHTLITIRNQFPHIRNCFPLLINRSKAPDEPSGPYHITHIHTHISYTHIYIQEYPLFDYSLNDT